jgi:hypothetical protein
LRTGGSEFDAEVLACGFSTGLAGGFGADGVPALGGLDPPGLTGD